MKKIFKQVIDAHTIDAINKVVDTESGTDNFEMLIPPNSKRILEDFQSSLRSQCTGVQWNKDSFVVIRSTGNGEKRGAQCWHFDNFRKTTLVVLKSFSGEHNGDILIRDNLRGAPKSLIMTMITKVFWTNPIIWSVLRIPYIRERFFTRESLVAGDVMVFDGSTTYHGNLPVDSGVRRSILIHEDPVFKDAAITKFCHTLCTFFFYKT